MHVANIHIYFTSKNTTHAMKTAPVSSEIERILFGQIVELIHKNLQINFIVFFINVLYQCGGLELLLTP